MMSHVMLFLPVVLLSHVSLLHAAAPTLPFRTDKPNPNKFISVHAACSRQALMSVVVLKDPFYGSLYARGYPLECRAVGDGSREVKLTVGVNQCGIKVTEKQDGSLQYDLHIYLQYDRHVQQAADELILVQCTPQEVVVSGRMGSGALEDAQRGEEEKSELHSDMLSSSSSLDCWMDILHGKMPTAVPITEHVNVGDDITMLIKIRQKHGFMAKVTNCLASDGSREAQQDLIDSNGCTVDPSIMPNLQEKLNGRTGIKVVYATFPAFKFPDRDNLHLQCRVLVCNNTCPLEPCLQTPRMKTRFMRSSNGHVYTVTGNIVDELNVFNSVEVKAPIMELDSPGTSTALREAATMAHIKEDLFCLSSTRMILIIAVLLGVLLISLVVTICMCVRARELRRRLVQRQSFPYGRVHDYS